MFVPLVSRGQTHRRRRRDRRGRTVRSRTRTCRSSPSWRAAASLAIDNARLYLESQQAVRAREEVLAIVSHDLRNPLNAVMLGASLLQMSDDDAPTRIASSSRSSRSRRSG